MTGTGPRQERPPDERPDGIQQHKDSEPGHLLSSRRPPDYVVIVGASDWVKEHFPAMGGNLRDAVHTGNDRHHGACQTD